MAIDFPNTPATNDTYTVGNKTWIYDGATWNTYNTTSFSAETLPGTTLKSTVTGSSLTSVGTSVNIGTLGNITTDANAVLITQNTYPTLITRVGEHFSTASVGTLNNDFTVWSSANVRIKRDSGITVATFNSTGLTVSGTVAATTYTGALASTVTATTQAVADNSTKVATTAFVLANTMPDPGYTTAETYGPPAGTATTGNLTTSRTYYASFYIGKSQTFDRIGVSTGAGFAGTATVRLGIYNMDTTTGKPSTVKFDAGTVSVTTTNTSTYITISQTLTAGWYFTAVNMQTAATTPTFRVNGPFSSSPFLASYNDNANGRPSFQEDSITGAFATAGTLTRQGNVICPAILRAA